MGGGRRKHRSKRDWAPTTNYSFTISDTHLGATKESGVISDNIYSNIYNASDPKSEGHIERGLKAQALHFVIIVGEAAAVCRGSGCAVAIE